MNARESAGIALAALRANKLRSLLTLLGVIIGVSSVIAVMSLVEGLNRYVTAQLVQSGSDVFAVRPGEPGAAKADSTDFNDVIKTFDEISK